MLIMIGVFHKWLNKLETRHRKMNFLTAQNIIKMFMILKLDICGQNLQMGHLEKALTQWIRMVKVL